MRWIFKRSVASFLLLCLLTGACATLPVMAEEWTLTTDKTVYEVGDAIYITATGSGTDWVGLYEANPVGKTSAAYWYYVAQDGHTSGDTVNIHDAEYKNSNDCPHIMGIPAGEYRILLCPNNGYESVKEVLITVKERTTPVDPSSVLQIDKKEYREGEPIRVTATGRGQDWVGLYKADDEVGQVVVGPWYYVAQDGNTSGQSVVFQEVSKFDGARLDLANIPAGEYKLVFFRNNSYQVTAEIYFTVLPVEKADPPSAVVYTSAGKGLGRAAGTVTVTSDETNLPFYYELWWGNAEGPLPHYTCLAKMDCRGKETSITLPDNTIIPAGADRILVYASNNTAGRDDLTADRPAEALLPAEVADYSFGELQKTFAVLGDLHINPDNAHVYNRHFASALADIKAIAPHAAAILVNGDVTDHGLESEWAAFRALMAATGDLPPVYAAVGNRDFYGQGTDADRINRFLTGTGNDAQTVYFDRWLKGIHCIFLGSEQLTTNDAVLSETQLAWLRALLEQDKADGKTAFVFLHQGLSHTVAGTRTGHGFAGVVQEEALRAILCDYPDVILFSGHSHWDLQSEDTMYPATAVLPPIFNTASTAYLWDSESNRTGHAISGAQGYYVYLYEKHIVIAARDYLTGEWLTNSLFVLDWTGDLASDTPHDAPAVPPTPETTPSMDETTADEPIETAKEPTSNDTTVTAAGTPTATEPGTERETEATASAKGCASQIGLASVLALLLAGAAVLTVRRRKEN